MELTVVLPCLNETETVAVCVSKAVRSIEENGIEGRRRAGTSEQRFAVLSSGIAFTLGDR